MTPEIRSIVRRLLNLSATLFLVFGIVNLLTVIQFLDDSRLVDVLPYHITQTFSAVLLHLSILSGLLGGGLYLINVEQRNHTLNIRWLQYTVTAWIVFAIVSTILGVFGFIGADGGFMLVLPPFLEILRLLIVAAILMLLLPTIGSPVSLIWFAGMVVSLAGSLLGLLTSSNPLTMSVLAALAEGLVLNVGYLLTVIALSFWLMSRFSNLRHAWFNHRIYLAAGVLALAGTLISLSPLHALATSPLINMLGNLSIILIPGAFLLFAIFSYSALGERKINVMLTARWYILGLHLLLIGVGLLGALNATPIANAWTQGTQLTFLQQHITAIAYMVILLGMMNQAAAEMRRSQRITSVLPFWLFVTGVLIGALSLAAAGLVQVYLERVLTVGYLETQVYLAPLYVFWVLGMATLALAALVFVFEYTRRVSRI